jgi:hypothetical protein
LAQGVALGINDGTGLVQRSIADMIGSGTPTSTSRSMLGNQPIGAAALSGAGNVYVTQVYAVKSDEMVNLLRQAERGDTAMASWESMPRAVSLVMGNS